MERRGLILGLPVLTLTLIVILASPGFTQDQSGDPQWAPTLYLPDDSLVAWCTADSICYQVGAFDLDEGDILTLTLLSGPIDFEPRVFGHEFDLTVCWVPPGEGEYTFVWQVDDTLHIVVDTVTFTIEPGAAPGLADQQFYAELCDLPFDRQLPLAYEGSGLTFALLSGPGTIDPLTGVITYRPDTSGVFTFVVAAESRCGSDTATVTDQLVLNLPPYVICFDTTLYLCDPAEICFDVFAVDPEGDPLQITMLGGLGTFVQTSDTSGTTCFMPAAVDSAGYSFIFHSADSCVLAGEAVSEPYCCIDTVNVIVIITEPGELACPGPTSLKFCVPPAQLPIEVCMPGFSSTWDNTAVTLGALRGDTLCFEADTLGIYTASIIGTDSCGHADTCTTLITVDGNRVPYVTMAGDFTIDLCAPEPICFAAAADDPDFDLASVTVSFGYYDDVTDRICFDADTSGTYTIVMTATDECSASASDSINVTVNLYAPPTVSLGGDLEFDLCSVEEICVDAIVTGERIEYFSTSSGAYYNQATGKVCFTPQGSGTYEVWLQAHDACGYTVADTVQVTVHLNSAPTVSGLADTSLYLCYPQKICWDVDIADPDADIMSITVNRGKYENGQVCLVAYSMGVFDVILTVTDSCGIVAADTALVDIKTDQIIELVCPGDTTVFLCEPDTLCFPVAGVPEGAQVQVGGTATWWDAETQSICFYSDCCLENTLSVSVTTGCGTYSCTFAVSVQTNSRPLVMLPPDTTVFLCSPGEVCLPAGINDIDGNVAQVLVDGATYDTYRNVICIEAAQAGVYVVTLTAIDSCGLQHSDQIQIAVTFNSPPAIEAALTDSVFRQCELTPVMIPFSANDPDGNFAQFLSDPAGQFTFDVDTDPAVVTGNLEVMPLNFGVNSVTLVVIDSCGETDSAVVNFEIVGPEPVSITCPETGGQLLCGPGTVCFDVPVSGDVLSVISTLGTWADGRLCIDAQQSIDAQVTIIVTGECSADTCEFHVAIDVIASPQITCPPNIDTLLCGPDTLDFVVNLSGGGGPMEDIVVAPPYWVTRVSAAEAVVHVPVLAPGPQTIDVTFQSPPCEPASCSFTVTATFNTAPSLTIADANFDLCDLVPIQIPFSVIDIDGNVTGVESSLGTVHYEAGEGWIEFEPTAFGVYEIIVTVTDACGAVDSRTISLTINEIPRVAIDCPLLYAPLTYCDPGPHCIDLPISGGEFTVTTSFGTWENGQLCFTFDQTGQFVATVIAQGVCNADTCEIDIRYLQPAQVACSISDTTIHQCELMPVEVEVPVAVSGDDVTVTVLPATAQYADGVVSLTLEAAGATTVWVKAANECSVDSCEFSVALVLNRPPVADLLPSDTTIRACTLEPICLPYEVSDPDGDVVEIRSSLGIVNGGVVCFTPQAFGDYQMILKATDSCGAFDADTVDISLVEGEYVSMTCPPAVIQVSIEIPDSVRVPLPIEPASAEVVVLPAGRYDSATDEVVVYIPSSGAHPFQVIATAECSADTCEFIIEAGQYIPPFVDCVGSTDTVLCLSAPRTVCLPVTVLGTGVQVTVTPPAVFTGDAVCLEVNDPGQYEIVVTAFNDRDTASCTSVLVVSGGQPPLLEMPDSLAFDLCEPGEICFDILLQDAEFDVTDIDLNFGSYDPVSNTICFPADTGGTYLIELTAADSCGNSATGLTRVTVDINNVPQVLLTPDEDLFLCEPREVCVGVSVRDEGPVVVTSSLGVYDPETHKVCFVADTSGIYELTVWATDECEVVGSATIALTIGMNHAPEIAGLPDTAIYLCYPEPICLPVSVTDADDNLASISVSRGQYSDGQVCFVPYNEGAYEIILTATDECGEVAVDTALVTITTDQSISLECPGDTTVFLCEPDTLCFPVYGVPEGADVSIGGIAAWWDEAKQAVCFFSECCLENRLRVTVTTPCGSYSCGFKVSVQTNSRPLVVLPKDTTILLCQLEPICLPVGISDIDGNVADVQVSGGVYDSYRNVVCFTPTGEAVYSIVVTATDSCGGTASDVMDVTVVLNEPPVITYVPKDTVYKQCAPEEICVPIEFADADGNIVSVEVQGGRYDAEDGTICIMPGGIGTFCAHVTITDACGLTDEVDVCVDVVTGEYVQIQCTEYPEPGPDLCEPGTVCYPLTITGTNFSVSTSFGSWADNQICFDADTSGLYVITVIGTSQCNADTCVVTVPITILEPLAVSCPPNATEFLCAADTLCYDFTFAPLSATVSVSAPAYLSGGQVCVPILGPGAQTITITASNDCGSVQCSFTVTATFNRAPTIALGNDLNLVECSLHEVCVPVTITDLDGNIQTRQTSLGAFRGDNEVCFTPSAYGVYQMIVTVTDSCGASDADTLSISYTEGARASILCPDGTQFASVCGPDTVCILAPVTPPGVSVTVSPNGRYNPATGEVCVWVTQGGTHSITVIAAGECASDTCEFNLEVDMGVPPVVTCPGRIDTILCLVEPDTLHVPVTVTGTGVQVNVNPAGYYAAGYVNLPISAPGLHTFRVIAFGTCGADTCEIQVDVDADQPPVLHLPADLSFERCPDDIDQICIDGIWATDAEGDVTVTKISGPGTFTAPQGDSGAVCFLPQVFGQIEFEFEADDGCHTVTGSFFVNITAKTDCDVCARIVIDGGVATPVGLRKQVAINIETNDPIGGFDLLIQYDVSALSFQSATMENGDAEAWEYFTWNIVSQGCGGGCPTGLVRFVGIADRNNGAAHPPDSAYTPNGTLFFIEFQVANNQNLGDQFVPINFVWYDCADNALSDTTGTLLYIDSRIYNAEHVLIWDEFDDVTYPESARQQWLGAPDSCVILGEKTQAVRCVEFYNGGIKIINPEEIDDRGDVNLNNIAYEIADAVMFTNYFIRGLSAFTINIAAQIAATDVNADGLTLTVADLAQLIRVVVGDADPIPKTSPHAEQAIVYSEVVDGVLRVSTETSHDLGAAWLVYDIAPGLTFGTPQVTAASAEFEVIHGVAEGRLRLLLYDIGTAAVNSGRNTIIEIPIYGEGQMTLVHSELVDYKGRPYLSSAAEALPVAYELMQNYPNPFNPSTTLRFALPQPGSWAISIYNITGALVWQTEGVSDGGVVEVVWDGHGSDGSLAASGVYLYKLAAGDFAATRKMVLLK